MKSFRRPKPPRGIGKRIIKSDRYASVTLYLEDGCSLHLDTPCISATVTAIRATTELMNTEKAVYRLS